MYKSMEYKEKQVCNVQKEILNNYFLQKYNNIMIQMTNNIDNYQPTFDNHSKAPKEKINFKNLILLKQNSNNSNNTNLIKHHAFSSQIDSSGIMNQGSPRNIEKEECTANKTIKKLQQTIAKELFKQSPTNLDFGTYNRVQVIHPKTKLDERKDRKINRDIIQNDNIKVTYDENESFKQSESKSSQEDNEAVTIKEAIVRQFSLRKEWPIHLKSSKQSSPNKHQQSYAKSSKISVQGKIESPKKSQGMNTPNRHHSSNKNSSSVPSQPLFPKSLQKKPHHSHYQQPKTNKQDLILEEKEISSSPKVHFSKQMIEPIDHQQISKNHEHSQPSAAQNEIEFIAPSSTYYKSQSSNFVQETFRFQQASYHQNTSSQKEKSFDKNDVPHTLNKVNSKKSFKDNQNGHSEDKESSRMQMSFVSKLSLLSTQNGPTIKSAIEKELFDNQLGPYQSALYGFLELIQRFPKSGPVYAVGQRTLEDRRQVEERQKTQMMQVEDYKKKIERLQRKKALWSLRDQDEIIRKNKLETMRLIRRIGTNL